MCPAPSKAKLPIFENWPLSANGATAQMRAVRECQHLNAGVAVFADDKIALGVKGAKSRMAELAIAAAFIN
jgi:hypothetical protein